MFHASGCWYRRAGSEHWVKASPNRGMRRRTQASLMMLRWSPSLEATARISSQTYLFFLRSSLRSTASATSRIDLRLCWLSLRMMLYASSSVIFNSD